MLVSRVQSARSFRPLSTFSKSQWGKLGRALREHEYSNPRAPAFLMLQRDQRPQSWTCLKDANQMLGAPRRHVLYNLVTTVLIK